MSTSSDRKFQLLLHKIGYLNLEIEEKKEKLDLHASDFNENYSSVDPSLSSMDADGQANNEGAEDSSDDSTSDETKTEIDECGNSGDDQDQTGDNNSQGHLEELRRIWKNIAIKTHPDKTGNDATMMELYKRASLAYDERRYEVLIEIAAILSIKIDNPSDDLIAILEARVSKLESDLKKIEDSVLWTWVHATPEKKRAIEEALRSYRKYKKKKKSKA